MAGSIDIDCAGIALTLMPDRAIWWAAQGTLFIADPHFGKAAAYRALGQPVPAGTTDETLARLDRLLDDLPVARLVILGDFLHSRASHAPRTLASLAAWRARHAQLECVLVRGNHDDRAGDPPAALGIIVVDEPYRLEGLEGWHHPPESRPNAEPAAPGAYRLAGHVHPVTVVRGRGRDKVRLCCFDMGEEVGVLPAFGAFTGGWEVMPEPGRRRYVIAGEAVFPV